MNIVIEIAKSHRPENYSGSEYITPDDVTEALQSFENDKVRLDVLEVLGGTSGFGAEDAELCAWVAWVGKTK